MEIRPFVGMMLAACATHQGPAVGVSTAPQSVPRPAHNEVPDAAAPATPEPIDAAAAPAVASGRLHAVTGMSTGAKKLDAKVVIARIEERPEALDACSVQASSEPNAPDGSWNVRLTLRRGAAALQPESSVEPGFERCLQAAAAQLSLRGLPDGELLLLLALQR